jgi:hypothetical protein
VGRIPARRTHRATHASLQSKHIHTALVCLAALLVGVTQAHANGTGQPPVNDCVWEAEDARARTAGESGGKESGVPRILRPAFYNRTVTFVVSADGLDGRELPFSIEAVCDIPEKLAKEATSLAGSNGVALRLLRTTIWESRALKIGPAAAVIDQADAAIVRGRLVRPRAWRQDEGGSRIATFRAGRIVVMD